MKINIKNKKIILITVLIVILIILGIIVFNIFKTNKVDDPTISSSFFIKDNDGNYALFNEKGKQLTDFIYTTADGFYNGVSRVADTSGNAGIINEKGKYVIDLGEYDTVIQYGSLFKVYKGDNMYLLNYNGKKIIKDTYEVASMSSNDIVLLIKYNNKYILYNYLGKKIKSFDVTENDTPLITTTDEYGVLYINNNSYVFNAKEGKILKKIENELLSINSYDDNMFILETYSLDIDEETDTQYKILKNNKVYDIDECDTIKLKNNNLICTYDEVTYLLDNNYKKVDINLSNVSYHDYKNYAIESDNSIKIIKNNKEVKVIDNAQLVDKGYVEEYYLIYKDNKYYYYNLSGKLVFEEYSYAYSFDTNNLAKVSIDQENYYFINNKGKKVSDEFKDSNQYKNYYLVTIDNNLGVMNNKGKLILDCIYDKIEIIVINDVYYAYMTKDDTKYLYNLDDNKLILETNNTITCFDYYIVEKDETKQYYYTLNGIKFYESES